MVINVTLAMMASVLLVPTGISTVLLVTGLRLGVPIVKMTFAGGVDDALKEVERRKWVGKRSLVYPIPSLMMLSWGVLGLIVQAPLPWRATWIRYMIWPASCVVIILSVISCLYAVRAMLPELTYALGGKDSWKAIYEWVPEKQAFKRKRGPARSLLLPLWLVTTTAWAVLALLLLYATAEQMNAIYASP